MPKRAGASTASETAGPTDAPPIPLRVRANVVVRSAWIQASLNYIGMQNLGRLFCLVPVARWLKLDDAEWPAFIRRHLGLFNSNPFISPLGIGALARLEADHKQGGRPLREGMIERFSERLSTPLGAVGDELFWAAVRPHMLLLGSLIALLWGVWGSAVFLAGFTVWQAAYRWKTFAWGWRAGTDVAATLRGRAVRVPARIAGCFGAVCAGALAVFFLMGRIGYGGDAFNRLLPGIVFVVAAASAAVWTQRQRPAVWALVGGMGWGMLAVLGEQLFAR